MPIIIGDPFDLANACILSYNDIELSHTACDVLRGKTLANTPSGNARESCISMEYCPMNEPLPTAGLSQVNYKSTNNLDFKVTKALGSKGYNKVRISVVSNSTVSSNLFTYQEQFKYKWTDNFLNTGIVDVVDGVNEFTIGGQSITVNIPEEGKGVRGVILADPCFQSNWISCKYKDQWDMFNHLTGILNTINAYDDVSFYQILGDNFYDQQGEYTKSFFANLTPATKSKLFLTTLGNHDFWVMGTPMLKTKNDQYGNGFYQYYGQDVVTSSASSPYDFSVNPDTKNLPPAGNFFTYNQVGNIAFMAYSGGHSYAENKPYFDEACSWAAADSIKLLFLEGHWNADGDGATDAAVPEVYVNLQQIPSCNAIYSKIRYFEGHEHCNYVTQKDIGFMVGANGMSDSNCVNEFGIAVVDTTNNNFQINYFQLNTAADASVDNYSKVVDCINQNNGISGCYSLATNWVNTPIN